MPEKPEYSLAFGFRCRHTSNRLISWMKYCIVFLDCMWVTSTLEDLSFTGSRVQLNSPAIVYLLGNVRIFRKRLGHPHWDHIHLSDLSPHVKENHE